MKNYNSDIVIAGSGLTGLCLANVLSSFGYKITIVDKQSLDSKSIEKNDFRTTAISEGSKNILDQHNLWKKISNYANPINKIKIFDRTENNKIDFINSNKTQYLGYIIENRLLKKFFLDKIKKNKKINIIGNIELINIASFNDYIEVISNKQKIRAKLLIAADGKFGPIKNLSKISRFEKKYSHGALVANISHSKCLDNVAYEIFKKQGPLAILPMQNNNKNIFKSSIIWSLKKPLINSFSDPVYIKSALEQNIEQYTGKILSINNKKTFKLSAHLNSKFYDYRLVFVGDSAHSVHPIAGQGWNLGIRDIQNLYCAIKEASYLGLDIGMESVLKNYNNKSFYDAFLLYQITDKLNSAFLNDSIVLKGFRKIGLDFINRNSKVNDLISSYAMGKQLNFFSFLRN